MDDCLIRIIHYSILRIIEDGAEKLDSSNGPNSRLAELSAGIDAFDGDWANVTVTNNVLVISACWGIFLGAVHTGLIARNTVVNDTLIPQPILGAGAGRNESPNSDHVLVANNIAPQIGLANANKPIVSANNNIATRQYSRSVLNGTTCTSTQSFTAGTYDNRNIEPEVMFQGWNASTLTLDVQHLAGSVPIGAGTNAGGVPTIDILGVTRTAPVGAYGKPSNNLWTPLTGNSSYKLVFDDEFNGTTLDTTNNWIGGVSSGDLTYPNSHAQWQPQNTTVHDGCADLTVTMPTGGTPNGSTYGTATLNSKLGLPAGSSSNSVYFEARLKYTPSATAYGLANVYWTNQVNTWTFPEVDFSEWWGFQPDVARQNWYASSYPGVQSDQNMGDLSAAWHTWGTLWTSSAITFYLDGVQTFSTSNGIISGTPWYTLIEATVGGGGAEPNGSTVFPSHFFVDYVHVYTNSSSATAITPQTNYNGPGDATGSTTCH